MKPYRLHENMPKSAKKEQSNWDKVLNWANDRIGMACKWEVWGKKRERGKRKDPRQSWEREKESLKVRVFGFKNAYRLERVSRIRLEKKLKFQK